MFWFRAGTVKRIACSQCGLTRKQHMKTKPTDNTFTQLVNVMVADENLAAYQARSELFKKLHAAAEGASGMFYAKSEIFVAVLQADDNVARRRAYSYRSYELFSALIPDLLCSPNTLVNMSKGNRSAVHGYDRGKLMRRVEMFCISANLKKPDEVTSRTILYDAVAHLTDALFDRLPPPSMGVIYITAVKQTV